MGTPESEWAAGSTSVPAVARRTLEHVCGMRWRPHNCFQCGRSHVTVDMYIRAAVSPPVYEVLECAWRARESECA